MSDTEMKSPKSAKKAKKSDEKESSGKTYEERVEAVNIIAKPLACKKSTKKAHKLVKRLPPPNVSEEESKKLSRVCAKARGGCAFLRGISILWTFTAISPFF